VSLLAELGTIVALVVLFLLEGPKMRMAAFVTLAALGVPFPALWALWVALVDFLPMIDGALAGIPTVLFALGHSFTAGLVTLVVFLAYTQVENRILNPLVSILVGTSTGAWIGGTFGAFVAALVSIPLAGALQITVKELWQAIA
jgi:predicted PurR-regulated permease PerM